MRLSTIKLSGFKSFVDPTTLHLPTNMTGIVGPNGCGKSNIIDAVRWVMGESSASRLRGDSLTDVIFSGSSARKPVSQATVELIFDNSDHTISGEYASFNEISVKRQVSRDGSSSYYLNGTKCRRRDITDLFLGTGLGPRSYSIIEQGMISQIIEARPEDLRVYLEEAAGISKYKERRKETETRIRHTRENLERLGDLREEIGKQLEHLKRQARQAEQYQALQEERRVKDAQWKALEYRGLDGRLQGLREALGQEETRLQQFIAEQRDAEARIETGRVRREEAADALSKAQAEVYQVGSTLARIEQQIQHQRDLSQRLHKARDEAQLALAELGQHISGDEAKLALLRESVDIAGPQLEQLQEDNDYKQEALREAEARLADWQQRWETHQRYTAEASRAGEVERTRVDYLDRQSLEAERRREALAAERAGLDLDALAAAFEQVELQHETQRAALDGLNEQVETRKQALTALQEQQRGAQAELAEVRKQAQAARGRLSSLETLQQAALGQEQGAAVAWLKARGLDSAARVGERISVENGWENAVEGALGQLIEGVLVAAPETLVDALGELGEGRIALVSSDEEAGHFAPTSLAAKVQGPIAIRRLLSRLHAAEDLAAARALLPQLGEGDSVITRDGARLGEGWLRVSRSGAAKQGALLREREIQALRGQIDALQDREAELDQRLARLREQSLAAEQQREEAQRQLYQAHRSVSELAGQLQSQQGKVDAARTRIARIETEIAQLLETLDSSREQAREARSKLEDAVTSMGDLESTRHALESERRQLTEARDLARDAARRVREASHALALTLESQRTQIASLSQALERMGNQRGQLDSRLGELSAQLSEGDSPVHALEAEHQAALSERVRTDRALGEARALLDGIDNELRGLEQTRQQRDEQALAQRERIAQRRLDQQALVLSAEQLSAAVVKAGFVLEDVINGLPEQADPAEWEQAVQQIDGRMRRLEPVNLAAISEYGEAAQRAEYLEAQDVDLNTALETLEDAIRKIDRETRGRFKDTFDRVNAGVQALYPRLFGGGHAYLELTGEDLLDTGVAIMARPPGKRVSSISLLSGGEKAMTAVALVFAIFQLNPAPFCLLDEVDAPLDEANVGRLAAMVKEMSEKVQFLFVSHNKATMEAAHQLSGVTMREPGVSRLVSVDLEEAARLAGAA
ncbi:chromosome segregation protein SMC [Xanthomonas translucens]|uniref:chromosome segregation protein SMC n=1 Tax=Xanthomonas campestris pv. translucens TaxID=343 RepID=UPI0002A7AB24|nr:chromosome segregation protein SMC [Xanthomonas translucens]AVY66464.1 chromosome segregation protein SMC [Xanthomonas translucens pv. undulosa]ELP95581.1 chromosome segregation protein [Xanthomonas translucens DAR61454]MBC3973308.1 chromosome segregation protein SMC [Xanthomonas translucens pv. undulosa]MCT8283698.1 chromosome segregation protein SMC [Xanthomonas translucens pv. undulosa]MCT8317975.1 chromosome segregation protein SMC [Xanthomonas translucens pv. undulosa]